MSKVYHDPFTRVHAGLWEALRAFEPFTKLVGENNQIDMSSEKYVKPQPAPGPGGVPEFMISQGALDVPVFVEGTQLIQVSQDYTLLITSDRINWTMSNRLKWIALGAFMKAGAHLKMCDLVGSWKFGGQDAQTALTGDPQQASSEYRATFVGRITVFINVATQAVINPATTF